VAQPAPVVTQPQAPAESATEQRRRARWEAHNTERARAGLAPIPFQPLAELEREVASGGEHGTYEQRRRAAFEVQQQQRVATGQPRLVYHPQPADSPILVGYRETWSDSFGECVTHALILALRFSGRTATTVSEVPFLSNARGRARVRALRQFLGALRRGTIQDARAAALQGGPGTQVLIAARRDAPHALIGRVTAAGEFELWDTWIDTNQQRVQLAPRRLYTAAHNQTLHPSGEAPVPSYVYTHRVPMTEFTDPESDYTVIGYRLLPF
jgi:hypothetical protein